MGYIATVAHHLFLLTFFIVIYDNIGCTHVLCQIFNRLYCHLQMTAHRAFQFCKQYKRTTEFRRLCEIIRNHLANLNKYRDQRDRPDLSAPESMQLYLDTRFEQLKIATELELWQVGNFSFFFILSNRWLY